MANGGSKSTFHSLQSHTVATTCLVCKKQKTASCNLSLLHFFPVNKALRKTRMFIKAPPRLSGIPSKLPSNSTSVGLIEQRSFPTSDGGTPFTSFVLPAIDTVTLWSVLVQRVPQASQYLCTGSLWASWMSALLTSQVVKLGRRFV